MRQVACALVSACLAASATAARDLIASLATEAATERTKNLFRLDRLQIDLWNARAQEFEAAEARTPASAGAELEAGEPRVPASPGLALRQRLSRSQPQA